MRWKALNTRTAPSGGDAAPAKLRQKGFNDGC